MGQIGTAGSVLPARPSASESSDLGSPPGGPAGTGDGQLETAGGGTTVLAGPAQKVLIVDDEPGVTQVIADAMEREGWQSSVAGTAGEAFEQLRREEYGLLVLDVMLPDMDGIMVHSRLRALDPDLAGRTIFISGWASAPEVRDYLEDVGNFLPKPFALADLLALARTLNR